MKQTLKKNALLGIIALGLVTHWTGQAAGLGLYNINVSNTTAATMFFGGLIVGCVASSVLYVQQYKERNGVSFFLRLRRGY